MSEYLFATCQIGAEDAVKAEMRSAAASARIAFSRPGFLTFKADDRLDPGFQLAGVFARCWGIGCGKADSLEDAVEKARAAVTERGLSADGAAVHAWPRDLHEPGSEPAGFDPLARFRALQSGLPVAGPLVLDAIEVDPGKWWSGFHLPGPNHRNLSGGIADLTLPPEAPSRSYLKVVEAEKLFGIPFRAGDLAVELGSAPGGASLALLEKGLRVIGVDPAPMDPITKRPEFRHVPESAMTLPVEIRVPKEVSWLLMDMNCDPPTALVGARRYAAHFSGSLLGVLLTLKVNEWKKAADLPDWLRRVRQAFRIEPVARQLFHHRQELVVYGLTELGWKRMGSGLRRRRVSLPAEPVRPARPSR